jgi:hypothetical protein
VVAFFAEWWSGPTSADRQGQNTDQGGYFDFKIKKFIPLKFISGENPGLIHDWAKTENTKSAENNRGQIVT